MIPAALSQAKADERLPALPRVLAWCSIANLTTAPKCDVVALELHIPRSTAARAIRTLVDLGYLDRAA